MAKSISKNSTQIRTLTRKQVDTNGPTTAQPQTEEERRPWPQFNAFRTFVNDELIRRKTSYPAPVNSPFVRLTSCKQDKTNKYAYFTLGLHGFDNQDINLFDQAFNSKVDIVGYAYDLTAQGNRPKRLVSSDELHNAPPQDFVSNDQKNNKKLLDDIGGIQQKIIEQQKTVFAAGSHPIPGITNVSVSRQGIGTPMIATVRWACYNRAQLEFLRNHFMITGGYVVLEWGQNFFDKQPKKILNFSDPEIHKELVQVMLQGRRYVTKQWVEPNEGNYDFLVGYIGNFTVDLDAQNNIYECSATLYGAGEHLFGLNSFLTFVDKESVAGSNDAHKPSTIHEFFKPNGAFDIMVRQAAANTTPVKPSVAKFKVDWSRRANGGYANAEEFQQFSNNPTDARFVSWEFFMTHVIPELFKLLRSDKVTRDLEQTMVLEDDDTAPTDTQNWVGDHPALRSTDPDVMVMVKRDARTVNDQAFAGIGYFGEEPDSKSFRGKLNHGIWVNTDAIRYAFTATNTFREGISNLLMQMNNSVANYWSLMLFYDDEISKYKIVDAKHINQNYASKFYKFNEKTQGETLNIAFDSAFPPELITQMALFSYLKTTDPNRRAELMNQYPSIGTTSTFIFALNWTDLDDILDRELAEARKVNSAVASIEIPTSMDVTKQNPPARTDARVTDSQKVTSINTQGKGQSIGGFNNLVGVDNINDKNTFIEPIKSSTHTVNAPWENAEAELMFHRSLQFKTMIESNAISKNIDPDFVKAIISTESEFIPGRLGAGRKTGGRGLMQIVYSTAEAAGFTGTRDELLDSSNSVKFGCIHLKDRLTEAGVVWSANFQTYTGDLEAAVSMFNLGNKDSSKGIGVRSIGGRFVNQTYVDRVIGFYNYFRKKNNNPQIKSGADGQRVVLTPPPKIDAEADKQKTELLSSEPVLKLQEADPTTAKFGASSVMKYIRTQPSSMIAEITKTGPEDYAGRRPNSFVAPFPTTTSVMVDIVGISGISVTDGFFVDKLPFIFERYGCFQVTEVAESISPDSGWITRVSGYFKLLWMNGEGV
jgi:hypothetical protein